MEKQNIYEWLTLCLKSNTSHKEEERERERTGESDTERKFMYGSCYCIGSHSGCEKVAKFGTLRQLSQNHVRKFRMLKIRMHSC
jgi:hypothetical protein